MPLTKQCLRQIARIREVASGEALPYVGRSRIGRLVRHLEMLVSDGEININGRAADGRRLMEIAKTICQPSEPLDTRWQEGWTELLTELDRLEKVMQVPSFPGHETH